MRPLALGLRAPYRLKRWVGLLAQATLNLNFTKGGPLDSRVTFSRASGGTSFRPVSYGPNLVANGTFDSLAGWVPQGAVTAAGGKLTGTTPSGSNVFATGANLFSVVAGKVYQLEYDFDTVTGSTHSIYVNNPTYDPAMNPAFATSAGRRIHPFVAKSTGLVSLDVVGGGGSAVGTFDNIVVREVTLDRPGDPIQLFTAPANIPRFDYDPVTRACMGLLVEEQRTNLITYSSDLSPSAWSKSAITPTHNAAIAPDGTLTATKLVAPVSASDVYHTAYATWTVVTGATYTYSRFVHSAEYTKVRVADIANGRWFASFDTVTGAVTNAGGPAFISAKMEPCVGGWWRLSLSLNTALAGTAGFDAQGYPDTGATLTNWGVTYAGDGTSGIYVWGAQLEVGALATSHIPTSGAAATRAADAATVNTLAPWHNATEGTLFAEFAHADTSAADRVVVSLHSTSWLNNAVHVRTFGSALVVAAYNGATQDVNMTAGVARATPPNRIAVAFSANNYAACLNGGVVAVDNTGAVPPVNVLAIGCSSSGGGNSRNSRMLRVAFCPRRMSNLDLQGLTR